MNKNLCKLPLGLLFLGLGISSLIYTPFEFLFDLRLRMLTGTLPYYFWRYPPENILMKVYVFNITNSERFLNGTDDSLDIQQIGPIHFREKLIHDNVVFNPNSTLTYTVIRKPVYLPERNTINLNDTIIVPNFPILTTAAYYSDSSFFFRATVNMMINKYKSKAIVNTTIYNYMLNFTDPLLAPAQLVLGKGKIPDTNVAFLNQIYLENKHNVTVFIGPKYGNDEFFNIEKWDGSEYLPHFKRCKTKFVNTSETTLFPQFIKRNQSLRAWKHILCKLVDLEYASETSRYGMAASRFNVSLSMFDRTEPSYDDCYRSNPPLPNGVADISACCNGFPFVASFPHFLNADPVVFRKLKGFKPDLEEHRSYLTMEKFTGVPIGGEAQFQISLRTGNLNGFNDQIRRFSNMFIPSSYVAYVVEGLPWYVHSLMYFMSVLVPKMQLFMSIFFVAIGLIFMYLLYLDLRKKVNDKVLLASVEAEQFLNKS